MSIPSPRRILEAFGLLLLFPLIALSQEMTEADALLRFERENPTLKALSARVREAQAEVRTWSRPANPTVTYSRENAAKTQDEFLLVQQSLPVNGRLNLMRKAGQSTVASMEAEASYERLRLRNDFRAAFFGLVAAQQRTSILEAGALPLREIVRVLQEREREREGSKFDRLRAERELAELEAVLDATKIILSAAQARLDSFFGPGAGPSSLKATGNFSDAAPLPGLEDLTARALTIRGDILAEKYRLERFGYEQQAAKRMMVPEPVLSAGLKRTSIPGLRDQGYAVSISVPLPLFDGGQAREARAKAAVEQSEAIAAARRRSVESDVRAAYEAVRLSRKIAQEYVRGLGDRGEELSRISRLSYEEGEQGILELLDSHRVGLNSRLQALEFSWSAKRAEIELNQAVGEEVVR